MISIYILQYQFLHSNIHVLLWRHVHNMSQIITYRTQNAICHVGSNLHNSRSHRRNAVISKCVWCASICSRTPRVPPFFRFFTFLRGFRFAGQTRSLPRLLSFSLTREAMRGLIREELARGALVFNLRERISASSAWVLRRIPGPFFNVLFVFLANFHELPCANSPFPREYISSHRIQ